MRGSIVHSGTHRQNWLKGPRQGWGLLVPLLVVIAPALLLIACFKYFVPPGDLFSDPGSMVHRLFDLARHRAIVQWYAKEFLRFGRWLLIPGTLLTMGFYVTVGGSRGNEHGLGLRTSELALALTLAGYFAVYLITPYDVYWHLRFSLNRLFLQLWPSGIFLLFLAVKCEFPTRRVIQRPLVLHTPGL
jgi:hypothetical protein